MAILPGQSGADEVGDGVQILETKLGQGGCLGLIADERHYVRVAWEQQGPPEGAAMELYLGKMVMLEPLDQQQIEMLRAAASSLSH